MANQKAKNKVIAGDYKGKDVKYGRKKIEISAFMRDIPLNSSTVSSYELVNKETKKDKAGALRSGLIWGAGGLIAHAVLSDGIGIYNVAIQFKDGKSCLVEIDEDAYQVLNKTCFRSGLPEADSDAQKSAAFDQQPSPESSVVPSGGSFFCTSCGNQVPAGSRFCNACGTAVVVPASPLSENTTVENENSDVITFNGRLFDLSELYDMCNGKAIKIGTEISKSFSFLERSTFNNEEVKAMNKAILQYCGKRKKTGK